MYYIVLGVQCVIITLLFVECWVVFKNWKGVLHSYLFLACVSMLVNSTGYLFELLARTEEAYFTALRLSYLGRAWISFSLLLFILELTRIRVPRIVKSLLAVYNVITYFIIITTKITGLYYKKTSFYIRGRFPVFLHENGIWHDINDGMLVICIFLGLTVLVISWCREKNPMAKGSIFAVAGAILVVSGTTVIQIFKPIPLAKVYDTTMVGFYFGSVLMFIAIFKYKLLDAETLAREYVIDELSEGIIAVNEKGDVNFSNVPALSLFPDLIKEPREVVNTIRNAVDAGEPLRLKDRIYTPESNILYRNSVAIGTIYALADDTEHYR